MSKQMAKHHKKSAGDHHAAGHAKRARGQKLIHPKKPVTQEEGLIGIATGEQQTLGEDDRGRLDAVLSAGSDDVPEVIEVLEFELVNRR